MLLQTFLKETVLCNETHYSTLFHLRVFDEHFEFLANLELVDDSPVISAGEIIFPEILAYNINKNFCSHTYTGDSNEGNFSQFTQFNLSELCKN